MIFPETALEWAGNKLRDQEIIDQVTKGSLCYALIGIFNAEFETCFYVIHVYKSCLSAVSYILMCTRDGVK